MKPLDWQVEIHVEGLCIRCYNVVIHYASAIGRGVQIDWKNQVDFNSSKAVANLNKITIKSELNLKVW